MRAMIVAAGLGTRLRPLTYLRPKPVVPVRGLPLVAYPLALLAAHGVREVIINTHHLPDQLVAAARRSCPPGVDLRFSHEEGLLGTGGGIRRAASFLRESDPCLILGGDMLLDFDLGGLVAGHRARGDALTLLLREDRRAEAFGSIGVDSEGRLRRIGRRFDLGGEVASGLYAWANVVSARAFDALPEEEVFSHLDGWIAPLLSRGARDVRGVIATEADSVWEPVGTPAEYLAANVAPARLRYLDADAVARAEGTRFEGDVVIGARAILGRGVRLSRAVVWDGERVPDGLEGHDGVFAGGAFHACPPDAEGGEA
ncbi:MAG TPA: NDP-sugar synthase [Myxococcota bacterium]|jgi:NDP-sugar pyrophosphorylase family protein|nr:NDP-sugar synthase [Myxococcota bacterium]